MVFKNQEKMTTNQVHEAIYVMRIAMQKVTDEKQKKRIEDTYEALKYQFKEKFDKFNADRLMFI